MDEKQNKRKNRSDDDRQNPVFLMVHKTVENNHFYCGLLLLMFMSIVTGYFSVRPEIPIYLGNIMKIYAIVSSRHSSHMTLALNDESSYTIYFQVKPVPYGNFIPGRFYIDPYDVISDIREK